MVMVIIIIAALTKKIAIKLYKLSIQGCPKKT